MFQVDALDGPTNPGDNTSGNFSSRAASLDKGPCTKKRASAKMPVSYSSSAAELCHHVLLTPDERKNEEGVDI
jgi:hypothetical protein